MRWRDAWLPHVRLYALVLAGACLLFAMVSSAAQAQHFTADDLRIAIPEKGDDLYYVPYLKWKNQDRIAVVVVQEPVDFTCAHETVAAIEEQVRLIRHDVPALALLESPTLVGTVPEAVIPSVVIVRPTADAKVADRVTRLPVGFPGSFRVYVADRSIHVYGGVEMWDRFKHRHIVHDFTHVTVLKVASDVIRLAYNLDINPAGEYIAPGTCSGYLHQEFYDLLGALNLNVPSIVLQREKLRDSPKRDAAIRRLFLRTLYAMPDDVVEPGALRAAFAAALNEAIERIEQEE